MGYCTQVLSLFIWASQNFAVCQLARRMEPRARCCWLGLAADLLARGSLPTCQGNAGSPTLAEAAGGGEAGHGAGCLFKVEKGTLWPPLCGV